ncbi:DUF397 domain-containing protein [Streptomyces xanthii]|uniref:DUF397 domain-containing protein n=1 Tax=Streptomyces xanthii TaxID=2768069 RepID=UPI001CB78B98|nr:DUF397 domain-containing protein [Streptomyces xanthii]
MNGDARLTWFKSSYSDDQGGNCVEAALAPNRTHIHIRDSKLGSQSPTFASTSGAWTAFLTHACATRTA